MLGELQQVGQVELKVTGKLEQELQHEKQLTRETDRPVHPPDGRSPTTAGILDFVR